MPTTYSFYDLSDALVSYVAANLQGFLMQFGPFFSLLFAVGLVTLVIMIIFGAARNSS